MRRWVRDERVDEAWALTDNPQAEAFYATRGFTSDDEQAVQLMLRL
jgi:hypothetical protein